MAHLLLSVLFACQLTYSGMNGGLEEPRLDHSFGTPVGVSHMPKKKLGLGIAPLESVIAHWYSAIPTFTLKSGNSKLITASILYGCSVHCSRKKVGKTDMLP